MRSQKLFDDDVVAVVDEDTGGGGRDFLDALAEGVVFEANCAPASGQRNAGEPILEIPRERSCARGVRLAHQVAVVVVGVAGTRQEGCPTRRASFRFPNPKEKERPDRQNQSDQHQ